MIATKKSAALLLVIFLIVGGVLRFIQFPDLLHFELDQARDARIIDHALTGTVFDLPLLGPRAGGTYFRLPPVFYYIEFLSATVFGGSPSGMAFFMPILSTLSILIFFLFTRRYFSLGVTAGMTAIFATSTFLVLYGRFAWNPNPLPFFILLGFYALLKACDEMAPGRGWWFSLATVSLSIAAELHSLAMVGLPIVVLLFLLWRRPPFSWKIWLGVAGLILLFISPVLLNEIETGGRNTTEFFQAVSGKSGKGDHPLWAKAVKNVLELSVGGGLIVSGFEHIELPNLKTSPVRDVVCDGGCREGLRYGLAALVFFGIAALLLLYRTWKEPIGTKKDFLVLTGIWLLVFFAVLTPIAYSYAPRFLLLIAPLPILLLGIVAEEALRLAWPKTVMTLLAIIFGSLAISNIFFTVHRLNALANAGAVAQKILGADRILKDKARVTYVQQKQIVDYMEARSRETGYPVFMYSEPQHRRALKYLLEKRGIQNAVLGVDGMYQEGVYFLILRSLSDLEDGTRKYRVNYDEVNQKQFGSLTLFEWKPKAELQIPERKDFTPPVVAPTDESRFAPRYTWREWWNRQGAMTEDDASDENDSIDNQ